AQKNLNKGNQTAYDGSSNFRNPGRTGGGTATTSPHQRRFGWLCWAKTKEPVNARLASVDGLLERVSRLGESDGYEARRQRRVHSEITEPWRAPAQPGTDRPPDRNRPRRRSALLHPC